MKEIRNKNFYLQIEVFTDRIIPETVMISKEQISGITTKQNTEEELNICICLLILLQSRL